ncbi:MAG: hypothetical protein ACXVAE_05385 [Candidatus Limnocylindrales bacterium]
MSEITVTARLAASAWVCEVTVRDGGTTSRHSVTVSTEVLKRLAPGSTTPQDLVRRSFEFLLEREPKESILASFDLLLIGRYFPEYEEEIRSQAG